MKRSSVVAIFLSVLIIPLAGFAAEITRADLAKLQEQIDVIRTGSIQGNSASAVSASALQEMQAQIEALKGALESNEHIIKTMADSVDLRVKEVEARISSLEETLSIQGKQVTSAVSAVAPEAAKEADLYQSGLNAVNNSEFLKGIASFKKFIKQYPKSDYAANAQYWIADCYFAMRDYEQSIKEFQVLKDKYKKSDKIPAALLKQGFAFMEIDMESDAKLFMNTLIKTYPSTKEAREARDWLERVDKMNTDAKVQPQTGGVPLAPGVVVPGQDKKSGTPQNEKY